MSGPFGRLSFGNVSMDQSLAIPPRSGNLLDSSFMSEVSEDILALPGLGTEAPRRVESRADYGGSSSSSLSEGSSSLQLLPTSASVPPLPSNVPRPSLTMSLGWPSGAKVDLLELRRLVCDAIQRGMLTSAIFFAETLVSLTQGKTLPPVRCFSSVSPIPIPMCLINGFPQ